MEDLLHNNIPVICVLHKAFPEILPPLTLLSSFSSLWGWNNPWKRVYSGSDCVPTLHMTAKFVLGSRGDDVRGLCEVSGLHLDNRAEIQSQGLDTRRWEGQRRVTENRRSLVHTLPVEVQGWESRKRGTCLSWRIHGSRGENISLPISTTWFPSRGKQEKS